MYLNDIQKTHIPILSLKQKILTFVIFKERLCGAKVRLFFEIQNFLLKNFKKKVAKVSSCQKLYYFCGKSAT